MKMKYIIRDLEYSLKTNQYIQVLEENVPMKIFQPPQLPPSYVPFFNMNLNSNNNDTYINDTIVPNLKNSANLHQVTILMNLII